eukprot:GHVU01027935.1.p1 GENE.GHVU01027935.1~~GHVU01027935.1.p1  ORF type:complete len:450 (+),score=91.66 GHVU01027935.1:180-1352(+)
MEDKATRQIGESSQHMGVQGKKETRTSANAGGMVNEEATHTIMDSAVATQDEEIHTKNEEIGEQTHHEEIGEQITDNQNIIVSSETQEVEARDDIIGEQTTEIEKGSATTTIATETNTMMVKGSNSSIEIPALNPKNYKYVLTIKPLYIFYQAHNPEKQGKGDYCGNNGDGRALRVVIITNSTSIAKGDEETETFEVDINKHYFFEEKTMKFRVATAIPKVGLAVDDNNGEDGRVTVSLAYAEVPPVGGGIHTYVATTAIAKKKGTTIWPKTFRIHYDISIDEETNIEGKPNEEQVRAVSTEQNVEGADYKSPSEKPQDNNTKDDLIGGAQSKDQINDEIVSALKLNSEKMVVEDSDESHTTDEKWDLDCDFGRTLKDYEKTATLEYEQP